MLAPANQVQSHFMSFVTNPALAAAAAAQGSMFPPPSMMNSPEALLGMPGVYAQHPGNFFAVGNQPGSTGTSGSGSTGMAPRMATLIGNQTASNGFNASQQMHQLFQLQTNQHPVPTSSQQIMQQGQNILQNHHQASSAASQQILQHINNDQKNQHPVAQTISSSQQGAFATKLGGVPIPALSPDASTALQVQVAAAAPLRSSQPSSDSLNDDEASGPGKGKKEELSQEEKVKQNRERNREHARSTRLRKKAYVQKLKELVEALHAERTEEVRKRRVAVQHLSEVQGVRRAVVRSFLRFHSNYESDPRKWMTILEDDFWFKQPVTPYRSFRRAEVEQECRICRGAEAVIADAASVSVMVEGIGSRSSRWIQLKREEVLSRDGGSAHMPHSIDGDSARLHHAVSSLSSSSGSSNGSGREEKRQKMLTANQMGDGTSGIAGPKKVSSSSGSSSESRRRKLQSNDFHDYHAPALPDPKLGDSEESSPIDDSPEDSNNSLNGAADVGIGDGIKHISTDSSSGDEDKLSDIAVKPPKRRKLDDSNNKQSSLPPNIAKRGGIAHNVRPIAGPPPRMTNSRLNLAPATVLPPFVGIGKKAPVPLAAVNATTAVGAALIHNRATNVSGSLAEGHQHGAQVGATTVSSSSTTGAAVAPGGLAVASLGGPSVIAADAGDTSSSSSNTTPQIRAYYHVNEDDMLLTEDVLMCPFIFRSQDAVLCGALSECIMPGMMRAHFSQRNKLHSFEMVYDAMGFMQQLERACGADNLPQVVAGSLEMALAPNMHEARVITLARAPFLIVSVNEAWTRCTKYTQMEVEGRELNILNGRRTSTDALHRPNKPIHKFDEVAKGCPACSSNIYYDKDGRDFVAFVCSYPLTK
jgi:hypothetical protein